MTSLNLATEIVQDVIILALGEARRSAYMVEIARILHASGINLTILYDSEEFELEGYILSHPNANSYNEDISGRSIDINEYFDKSEILSSFIEKTMLNSTVIYFGSCSYVSKILENINCHKLRIYPEPFDRRYFEGPSHVTGLLSDGAMGKFGNTMLPYHRTLRKYFSFAKQGVFPKNDPNKYFCFQKLNFYENQTIDILLCPEWYYNPFGTRQDNHLCVGFVSQEHSTGSEQSASDVLTSIGSVSYLPGRLKSDIPFMSEIIGYAKDLVNRMGSRKIAPFDMIDNKAVFDIVDERGHEKRHVAVHSGEIENVAWSMRLGLPQIILLDRECHIDNAFRVQQLGLGVAFDIAQRPSREIGILLQYLASEHFSKEPAAAAISASNQECGLTNVAQLVLERSRMKLMPNALPTSTIGQAFG